MRTTELLKNAIWPRRCLFCRRVIGSTAVFCADCADVRERRFHNPPRIAETEHTFLQISGAATVFYYEKEVSSCIRTMKFGSAAWMAREFALLMAARDFGYTFSCRCGIIVPEDQPLWRRAYTCIVPVPPHEGRGRFHAPYLMAQELGRTMGIPVRRMLVKTRKTPHQEELGFEQRLTNVMGAFGVKEGCSPEGEHILLVDDVITTGATVSACAAALMRAGAEDVFAVSAAVVEPHSKTQENPTEKK